MTTLTFENELAYSGKKAVLPVRLVRPRVRIVVDMTLDSGAEISVLNRRYLAPLGLDVTDGAPVHMEVASGEIAPAWIHEVDIHVLGRPLRIEAAFCPDWNTANLLGMRGFFDQMVVAFDHAQRRIYV